MPFIRSRTRLACFVIAAFVTLSFLLYVNQNAYQIHNTLSYATRPIWDKDDAPNDVVRHYSAEGLMNTAGADYVCRLHGWSARPVTRGSEMKVLDAVLMSSELDLLEIRMNELADVVDYFLIVESNTTFTGLPKEAYFEQNRARFAKFEHKIVYHFFLGHQPGVENKDSAWDVEGRTRDAMSSLIRETLVRFPTDTQTLVIMSDVDEMPSGSTISLLKTCDFGQSIHLQLRNYMYSFEWFLGINSWRASVTLWNPASSYYRHSKSGERVLADSGWHCSFCFRTIEEYAVKMKGFSHADRIGGRIDLLDPRRIQEVVCKGRDIFGMLPEAYSYKDLFSQMNLSPQKSAVGLPRYLLENASKFKFLLPGGCRRTEQY